MQAPNVKVYSKLSIPHSSPMMVTGLPGASVMESTADMARGSAALQVLLRLPLLVTFLLRILLKFLREFPACLTMTHKIAVSAA